MVRDVSICNGVGIGVSTWMGMYEWCVPCAVSTDGEKHDCSDGYTPSAPQRPSQDGRLRICTGTVCGGGGGGDVSTCNGVRYV